MFKYFKYIFVAFILLYDKEVSCAEVNCTSKCVCDLHEGLRRATCDNGQMVHVNANIPQFAEILQFRFNYVSRLENDLFINNNLTSLKLLNLSHNRIAEINIYTFNRMDRLKTLDLSFNSMQYILAEWFWQLESLQEFYISNNNIITLKEEPIFDSKTLKVLSMANCETNYIPVEAFSKLPNLEYLDISGNRFVQLDINILKFTPNLSALFVNGTDLKCGDGYKKFITYCQERSIRLDETCNVRRVADDKEKFQRMINPDRGQNSWILDEDDPLIKVDCPTVVAGPPKETTLLMEIIELSPVLTILFTLTTGFLVGLAFGCSCELPTGKYKTVTRRKRIKRNSVTHRNSFIKRNKFDADEVESLCEPETRF